MKAAVFYGPRDVRTEEVEKPGIEDNEIRSKKIDRTKIISHELPLDRTKEGFETQCNVNESVKVLIKL